MTGCPPPGPRSGLVMVRVFITNLEFLAALIRFLCGSILRAELSELSERDLSLMFPALPKERFPCEPKEALEFLRLSMPPPEARKPVFDPEADGLLALNDPCTAPSFLLTLLTPE